MFRPTIEAVNTYVKGRMTSHLLEPIQTFQWVSMPWRELVNALEEQNAILSVEDEDDTTDVWHP